MTAQIAELTTLAARTGSEDGSPWLIIGIIVLVALGAALLAFTWIRRGRGSERAQTRGRRSQPIGRVSKREGP